MPSNIATPNERQPARKVFSPPNFVGQLAIMGRVVTALLLRETLTRFGKKRFGYILALFEPVAYIGVFIAIRGTLRDHTPFGESVVLFLLTGLVSYRIFVTLSGRLALAISSNKALLTYPPVKPPDVILARFLLETLTLYVVVTIFYLLFAAVSETEVIIHPATFAAALGAVTLLGTGAGVFNSVMFILVPFWQIIWNVLRLPLFIASGIFYLPMGLPQGLRDVLWWNPVLHVVEWSRVATYLTYQPLLDRPYPIVFGLVLLTIGLMLERICRYKILAS